MKGDMEETHGSCHCGDVRWVFTPPIKTVVKCHCGNCRKLQGSDYSTWVVVPSEQFHITEGERRLTTYRTGVSSKSFCPRCGTAAYLVNGRHFPGHVVLALGSLDGCSDALAPHVQVYTPDRAVWVKLHDDEPVLS
ncbi:GFA family protein [Algihabitans albus]|uniref:GFA family protein n=1 Tax=Algihabitans albus TaxID=2164067 RepID=UPI000E5D454D|nr:GFA family protein [Algihabitans albus]